MNYTVVAQLRRDYLNLPVRCAFRARATCFSSPMPGPMAARTM
jgi:hypothetical protein